MNQKSWIQLASGDKFYPLDNFGPLIPTDIANSLAKICRYGGQCSEFYSVARHSINVAKQLPPHLRLWGILHDTSEFVMGDVVRPVKYRWWMWPYRRAERKLSKRVAEQFGLEWPMPEAVHIADNRMLATEVRQLFPVIHPDWAKEWLDGIEPYDTHIDAHIDWRATAREWLGFFNFYREGK